MIKTKVLGALAAISLLAGCVGTKVETLSGMEPSGSAFTAALFDEYKALSEFEAYEMYDWIDADYYAEKAAMAAAGEAPEPAVLENWDLPAEYVGELTEARAALVAVLADGAADRAPETAARAQAKFDCWVEQQEENFQPEHIAACKDGFWAAMKELQPAPMAMAPATYTILFAFDSAVVSENGIKIVDAAIAEASRTGAGFALTGHTDRAGPEDYNMKLSLRRAEAVRAVLLDKGVDSSLISVAARGESEPAVPTADGVAERANRRVEILLQ
jgi:OOP family OmpA-OmpF porin